MDKENTKRFKDFIFFELVIFLSQSFLFFMTAVFFSNFLADEDKLVKFAKTKISETSLPEFGLIFLSIMVVTGFFTTIGFISENKNIENYIREILNEMPRTIYFFGSTIFGTMLAIALFAYLHPLKGISAPKFAVSSFIFAFTMFAYGSGFKIFINRKKIYIPPKERK